MAPNELTLTFPVYTIQNPPYSGNLPVGYRCFLWYGHFEPQVQSLNVRYFWTAGWNKAEITDCNFLQGQSGFYSYSDLATALVHWEFWKFQIFDLDCIIARIEMKGNIAIHEHGFRAEYARVETVFYPRGEDRINYVDQAKFFGVPLEAY